MSGSYIQFSLVVVFIILIISIMVAFVDNYHFRDFIHGFWKTEGGENDIVVYFDPECKESNLIISRNGRTLAEKKYMTHISDMGAFSNITDLLFRPRTMKFNVVFEANENAEMEELDDYDDLFVDKEFIMKITMDKGICTLQSDDTEMFLIKDNITNYKFLEYVLT